MNVTQILWVLSHRNGLSRWEAIWYRPESSQGPTQERSTLKLSWVWTDVRSSLAAKGNGSSLPHEPLSVDCS
jgi:hypothetical protein